jgi:hypothetical protein
MFGKQAFASASFAAKGGVFSKPAIVESFSIADRILPVRGFYSQIAENLVIFDIPNAYTTPVWVQINNSQ